MSNIPHIGDHYYHYKHDSTKGKYDHCYEIIEILWDTACDELAVVYKPLYESDMLTKSGATAFVQPVSRFLSMVRGEDGVERERFVKVEDEKR
jgi:hypothetical protein